MEENEEDEAVEELVDIVDVAEAERCVALGGLNGALGGEGGTTHTADSSMLLLVDVRDRPQFAPISDIGTEALANSSHTKFCLNVCGVGGTTSILTEINKGCTNLASMTINVTSSFFSKHNEVISDFCVKVGCL